MKQRVFRSDFRNAFNDLRPDNFSYSGLNTLFDYLEELEEIGQEIELDVIALCCDYTEDTIANVLQEYSLDSLDELQDNTTVLKVDDETIIYQNY